MTLRKNKYSYRWLAYIFGTLAYMISMFHRVEIAVLAPYIIDLYKVSNSSLGFLSGIYFYVYSFSQPIAGVMGDKLKPKNMLILSLFVISLGTFIFTYATNIFYLYIGRFLIGLGCAGIFIPNNLIVNNYFNFDKKGFLLFIQQFTGNIGSILATSPLAYLVSLFNWKGSLTIIGTVSVILGLLIWILLKEDYALFEKSDQDEEDFIREEINWFLFIKNVLFKIPIIKFCILSSISMAVMLSFQSLWVVPYLIDVYKLNKAQASSFATLIPTGFVIGLLLFSKLSDKRCGKFIYLYSNIIVVIISIALFIFTDTLPVKIIPLLLFLFGFSRGTGPYIYKIYTLVIPKKYYGAALGILNMAPFLSTAIYQSITGVFFDILNREDLLYQSIFSYRVYFLLQTTILLIAVWSIMSIIKILKTDYTSQI